MNLGTRKSFKKILTFLLVFAMVLPICSPISAYAAGDLYLAYQTDEGGTPTVKLDDFWREKHRVDELFMDIGDKVDLCFINATFWKSPVWTSSNTSVATVDTNGMITAVGEGVAEITFTYTKKITGRKVSASAVIYVGEKNWNSIELRTASEISNIKEYAMKVGTDLDLKIYGLGELDAFSIYSCEWTSSNPDVVEKWGDTLYARKAGTANVSAKITNKVTGWSMEKEITVTVTDPELSSSTVWDNLYYLLYGENYKALFKTGFLAASMEIEQDITDAAWDVVKEEINTIGIGASNELLDLTNGLTIGIEGILNGKNYKVEEGHREAVWFLIQEMLKEDSANRQYLEGVEEALQKADGILTQLGKENKVSEAVKMMKNAKLSVSDKELNSIVDYVIKDEAGDIADLLAEGITISEYLVVALYMYELDAKFLDKVQQCSEPGQALYEDIELIKKDKANDPVTYFKKKYVCEAFAKSVASFCTKVVGKELTQVFDAAHTLVWMFSDMEGVSSLSKVTKATYLMSYLAAVDCRITGLRTEIKQNYDSYSEEQLIEKIEEYEFLYDTYLAMVPPVLEAVEELGQYGYDMEVSADASIVTGGYDYDRHIAMAINLYMARVTPTPTATATPTPTATVTPTPTATPSVDKEEETIDLTDAQLQARMYELVERLLRANKEAHGNLNATSAYFTTTGESLKADDGTGCLNTAIVQEQWFKDEFGSVSVSNFPVHLPRIGRADTNVGYSCFGFACFAQWYIYKSSNAEKITAEQVKVGTFTKEFLTQNLEVGDVIRIYITKNGASYYHSMVFHSFTENGIKVLDSNLAKDNKVCIEEIRYDRAGWNGDKVYIYRVDNSASAISAMDIGNGITISEGTRYSFKNVSSEWHMNVRRAGKTNGTHVNLWPLDMSEPNTQCYTFSIVSRKEKTVMISPICAPYMYLDVRHGGNALAPSQKICIWESDGDTSKELVIEMLEDGSCYLTFKDNRDYCIGAASATAAETKQTQLVICKKSGAPEQRWFLCDENGTPLGQ